MSVFIFKQHPIICSVFWGPEKYRSINNKTKKTVTDSWLLYWFTRLSQVMHITDLMWWPNLVNFLYIHEMCWSVHSSIIKLWHLTLTNALWKRKGELQWMDRDRVELKMCNIKECTLCWYNIIMLGLG